MPRCSVHRKYRRSPVKVTEAQKLWREHQAVQVRGKAACVRCPGPRRWPCFWAWSAMPVLDRSGFFDR